MEMRCGREQWKREECPEPDEGFDVGVAPHLKACFALSRATGNQGTQSETGHGDGDNATYGQDAVAEDQSELAGPENLIDQ